MLKGEAEDEKAELQKDIDILRADKEGIADVLRSWEDKVQDYISKANDIRAKHEAAAHDIERQKTLRANLEEEAKREKQNISDLQEIKKGLFEQVMKEFKGVTPDKLSRVTKNVRDNGDEEVGIFLLDSLTKFFTGNPDSTYISDGQDFFKTVDDFDTAIRKLDHLSLEKKVIEQMMQKITGESGKPEEGEIYQKISDERQIDKYINFYPFFRLLSKVCHLAFTKRKEAAHAKKQKKNEGSIEKIDVEIETLGTIQEQFAFFQILN